MNILIMERIGHYTGDGKDNRDKENIGQLRIINSSEIKARYPYTYYFKFANLLGKYPYQQYIQRAVKSALIDCVSTYIRKYRIDLIHLWNVSFAEILKDVSLPKILTAGDAFSLMHYTLSKTSKFPRNYYYKRLYMQFKKYEKDIYKYFDAIVFFSERDKEYANLSNDVQVKVIPNGVDTNRFYPNFDKNKRQPIILFHGNFLGTPSNRESAEFIIKLIYPHLIKRVGKGNFIVKIIGNGAKKYFGNYETEFLKIIDYIPSIEEALRDATIYIAPIFSGSGIKNKVLEAMATGLPVIGTIEAFEAIGIENWKDGIIAGSEEEFIYALCELIYNSEKRKIIGESANRLINQKFSWKKVVFKYLELYNECYYR